MLRVSQIFLSTASLSGRSRDLDFHTSFCFDAIACALLFPPPFPSCKEGQPFSTQEYPSVKDPRRGCCTSHSRFSCLGLLFGNGFPFPSRFPHTSALPFYLYHTLPPSSFIITLSRDFMSWRTLECPSVGPSASLVTISICI